MIHGIIQWKIRAIVVEIFWRGRRVQLQEIYQCEIWNILQPVVVYAFDYVHLWSIWAR